MEELWKTLDSLNCSNYEVSNTGKVRNINTGHIFVQYYAGEGNKAYHKVRLKTDDGILKSFHVGRLVAIAFVPNPLNKPEVDHIDGDIHNNHYTNLRWVTRTENMNNPITKERQCKANKEFTNTTQFKEECSKRTAGDKNPMYGRVSPNKGTKWMNNGKDEMRVFPPWDQDMLIFGWTYGQLESHGKKQSRTKRKMKEVE